MLSRISVSVFYWFVIGVVVGLMAAPDKSFGQTAESGAGDAKKILVAAAASLLASEQVKQAKSYQPESGPWGTLAARTLTLEPPDRLASEFAENPAWRESPRWLFDGKMEHVLTALKNFGIDEEWAARLAAREHLVNTEKGVEFVPPESFLRALSPEQRAELYRYVGPFESRNPYHNPISMHSSGLRYMAAMSPVQLSETMIDSIEALSFQRKGKGHFFSDLHLCLQEAQDAAERMLIIKTVGRQFSLRVQLRISEQEDLSALTRYWGGHGRNKAVLPLLQSVAETSGVEMLDIIHLLPPVPRQLLHSYPTSEMLIDGERPDCFSTSVSFFADAPPQRYLDSIWHVLDARYEKATQPWQFGDLILMRDPDGDGKFEHACNYVAADIVFTKNGSDLMRPWVLSRLSEVMNEYLNSGRLTAVFFRLKPQFQR